MTKVCARCRQEKPLDDFNLYARSKDGRQRHCRACSSAYYQGNKVHHIANVGRRNGKVKAALRWAIWNYLLEHPCVDCGESDPVVLEFDHVRGIKTAEISAMARNACSWERIREEIDKCDVRCANCHRRRTAEQFGFYAWAAVAELEEAPAF